jgi:hypothetical protein
MPLPKKLKVILMETPWTELRSALTGDAVHDREVLMNFCSRVGKSEQTALAKVRLFDRQTARTEQPRSIRSGRANPKRA